ncbi:MAG: transcriptional repressor [Deltaproteobacteria bacterium]|nr:transcriptional repressor [Deltaproteobacteria bacterium]
MQNLGWKRRLTEYIRTTGGHVTAPRLRVAEVFFDMDGHPGIEELHRAVEKRYPGTGGATVYRTMKLLCDSGLACTRDFGDGFARYEALDPAGHHDHLICTACGKIIEFGEEAIEELQEHVSRRHGFQMRDHRLDIYGLCRECAKIEGVG